MCNKYFLFFCFYIFVIYYLLYMNAYMKIYISLLLFISFYPKIILIKINPIHIP